MAIVYAHTKPDGEVFYVGIGVTKKRAKSIYGRNKHWHNTVNKYGFNVNILFDDVDYDTAKQCERYLIKYYGRKDLGLGTLVNFTDGGEGFSNMSDEQKDIRRKSLVEYNKNKKDYSFTQDEDYRKKMSKSCKGKGCKRIVDSVTGIEYASLTEASETFNMSQGYLSGMLNNRIKNKTSLRWIQ